MHPKPAELRRFVEGGLPEETRRLVAEHVNMCEFCTEFCDNYRQMIEPIVDSERFEASPVIDSLVQAALSEAKPSAVVKLAPLWIDPEEWDNEPRMAADGTQKESREADHAITLCSVNPEVVMRVVANEQSQSKYLQLLSDDDELTNHVMVQIPDLEKSYVTDATGRAEIDVDSSLDLESLKWQIKLPEAVFELEPLDYDPDKVQDMQEVTLESEDDDQIVVRLETMTEGKSLKIMILRIGGDTNYKPIKVAISNEGKTSVLPAKRGETLEIADVDPTSTIRIRLFTE